MPRPFGIAAFERSLVHHRPQVPPHQVPRADFEQEREPGGRAPAALFEDGHDERAKDILAGSPPEGADAGRKRP